MRRLVWLLLVVGCAKRAAPVPDEGPRIEGALHQQRCGAVTAAWVGKRDDGPGPDWFFTERLDFHFENGAVLTFHEKGELYPHNRSFELFSPDCLWALLPQDNYGPYHLVPVAELEAYLKGATTPVEVKPPREQAAAAVLTEQRWLSATQLEFTASCCGGAEVYRVSVEAPQKPERTFFAASAPHGLSRGADGGYSVAP